MSEPSTVAATAPTPGRPWGQRWLDRCDDADRFGSAVIEVGRTYALHDWQLELHLEPGRAETTARSGPRVRHEVVATHPPLDDDTASTLLDLIAGSGTQTAALLDRELEPDLLERAADLGVDLLPDPSRLDLVCSCPHHDGVCKHQAAILFLLADAFDEQPFDLLLFRGLPHAELVERVARMYMNSEVNSLRQRVMAQAGSRIIQWVGDHANELSSPRPPDPSVYLRGHLADDVEKWLAVTGTTRKTLQQYAQPAPTLSQPTIPAFARMKGMTKGLENVFHDLQHTVQTTPTPSPSLTLPDN